MISVDWKDYTQRLNHHPSPLMKNLTEYALANGIPIMQPEAMSLVEQLIRVKAPQRILEIGTAIGWSAINMAKASGEQAQITTVEKNPEMVAQAQKNLKALQLSHLIEVLEGDVLELADEVSSRGPYDLILIDAGKGHYQDYFTHFLPMLSSDGMMICDNVYFRGYAIDPELAPKRLKRLAKKMQAFNQWLSDHKDFVTVFVPVGDGLSISTRTKIVQERKDL